ncbi:hypothetical protein ABK040_008216 [Willaertia magna]
MSQQRRGRSIIKTTNPFGSIQTITRQEKRCFVRYINTVMAQVQDHYQQIKNKMIEENTWQQFLSSFEGSSSQNQGESSSNNNNPLVSPRGRKRQTTFLNVGDIAVLDYWKPLEVVGVDLDQNLDLYERLKDGLIFCHMLNKIRPDVIEWTKVNKRSPANPNDEVSKFQQLENQNYVLDVAETVGCSLIGVGSEDLVDGKPGPSLALLWQLIRIDVTKRLHVTSTLKLIALKEDNESVKDFMKNTPNQMLLRYVNYQLKRGGKCVRVVNNFSEDWKDGEVFCYLIKSIVDDNFKKQQLELAENEDELVVEVTTPRNNNTTTTTTSSSPNVTPTTSDSTENSPVEKVTSSNEDSNETNKKVEEQVAFTEEDIKSIMSTEDLTERAKKIIDKINELGLNSKLVQIEPEDIVTGVSTLVMTIVGSIFSSTDPSNLTSETTEDPEKMTVLRKEILDNIIEMAAEDLPEIKSPEMKVLVDTIKDLSHIDFKDIEQKLGRKRLQKMKGENRKLKKQSYLHFLQNEQIKKRNEELEKLVLEQKQRIEELEKKNSEKEEKNVTLQKEVNELNESRKQDLLLLGEQDFLNSTSLTAEDIRKKTSAKIEELVKRVAVLKENLVQTKKDLNYGMTLAGDNAEQKLAEHRFGNPLTAEMLIEKHKPTKVGLMEKKGRLKKSYKRRFFVLVNNYLFYFTKEKKGELKGFLRIEDCEIDRIEEEKPVFSIKTLGRVLVCKCESADDREDWVHKIYDNSRLLFEDSELIGK